MRAAHERAAERHALALAAGELRRRALEERARPSSSRDLLARALRSRARQPRHLEREGDVLAHGHVRVERVALEHHRDVALARGAARSLRWPSMRTSPARGRSRPATRLSVVDLPQPDGPTSATSSPSATSRSTPRSARTAPYDFVASRRSRRTPATRHPFTAPAVSPETMRRWNRSATATSGRVAIDGRRRRSAPGLACAPRRRG